MSRLVIDFQKRHVSIDFRTAGLFTSHANSGIPFLVAFFDRFAHGILFSGYQNENALSQIHYSTLDHLKSTSISWPTKVHFHSEFTKFCNEQNFLYSESSQDIAIKSFCLKHKSRALEPLSTPAAAAEWSDRARSLLQLALAAPRVWCSWVLDEPFAQCFAQCFAQY